MPNYGPKPTEEEIKIANLGELLRLARMTTSAIDQLGQWSQEIEENDEKLSGLWNPLSTAANDIQTEIQERHDNFLIQLLLSKSRTAKIENNS